MEQGDKVIIRPCKADITFYKFSGEEFPGRFVEKQSSLMAIVTNDGRPYLLEPESVFPYTEAKSLADFMAKIDLELLKEQKSQLSELVDQVPDKLDLILGLFGLIDHIQDTAEEMGIAVEHNCHDNQQYSETGPYGPGSYCSNCGKNIWYFPR